MIIIAGYELVDAWPPLLTRATVPRRLHPRGRCESPDDHQRDEQW